MTLKYKGYDSKLKYPTAITKEHILLFLTLKYIKEEICEREERHVAFKHYHFWSRHWWVQE